MFASRFTRRVSFARRMSLFAALGATALSIAAPAALAESKVADKPAKAAGHAHDIVDTAVAAGSFKTLAAALKAAGLIEALKGPGPFTVFAPTDEAFAKLPAGTLDMLMKPENLDKLKSILTYHVLPGRVYADQAVTMTESTKTVQGSTFSIKVKEGKVWIGNA